MVGMSLLQLWVEQCPTEGSSEGGEKEIYKWFPLMTMEIKAFQAIRRAQAKNEEMIVNGKNCLAEIR